MCTKINLKKLLGIGKDKGQELPPTITPMVKEDSTLPVAKKTIEEDKVADVSFGSKKKRATLAEANKAGAAGLKIPLNLGNTKGVSSGGLNV